MLSIDLKDVYLYPEDIAKILEWSIENWIKDNNLTDVFDHFSLENINVNNNKNETFKIIFSGDYYGENMKIIDIEFSFSIPYNFNMGKVVKRFWNEIISKTNLESKGFKKVEVDDIDFL